MVNQIMVCGRQREMLPSGYAPGLLGIFEDVQHAQLDVVIQMFFARRAMLLSVRYLPFSLYSMLMQPCIDPMYQCITFYPTTNGRRINLYQNRIILDITLIFLLIIIPKMKIWAIKTLTRESYIYNMYI